MQTDEKIINCPQVIPICMGPVNSYIIKDTRSILVDTGYPESEKIIMDKLSENGINPEDVTLILLTHGHTDHTGSAAELKELTGAPAAIHFLDAEVCRKGINPPVHPTGIISRLLKPFLSQRGVNKVQVFEPDILIKDEMNLNKFGVNCRIIFTPGHTPGSISIVLPDKKIIAGDLIMRGMSNRPNYPFFADDITQVKKSIKLIMKLSPTQIFSGHGGPYKSDVIYKRFSKINPGGDKKQGAEK